MISEDIIDKIYVEKVRKIIDEYTGKGGETVGWILGSLLITVGLVGVSVGVATRHPVPLYIGPISLIAGAGRLTTEIVDEETEGKIYKKLKEEGIIK